MLNITGSKKRGYTIESDSLQELTEWAVRESAPYGRSSRYHEPSESWDFSAGFNGMRSLVKSGWHVGTNDIAVRLEKIQHRVEEELVGYRNDVTGQFFDVGLVLAGEPECWYEQDYIPKRQIVKIAAQTLASCRTSAELIRNRGAAIVALVEKLQAEGYIVELSIICYAESGGYSLGKCPFVCIKLNMGSSPIDIDAASFCLAHPAFVRRLYFAVAEAVIKGDCGTYGSSRDSHYNDDSVDILLGRYVDETHKETSQFRTIAGAAEWVRETVERVVSKETMEAA